MAATTLAVVLVLRPSSLRGSLDPFLEMDYYDSKLGRLIALGAVFSCGRTHVRPMLWPSGA